MEALARAGGRHGRRTKIIATVGPASWDEDVLTRVIEAGADVLRLNFSHADRDRHARTIESIRAAGRRAGHEVAVLGDLPGPKLRIGELRGDVAELRTGMHVQLTPRAVEGDEGTIPVSWPGLSLRCARTSWSTWRTGRSAFACASPRTTGSIARSRSGAPLSSHKGMNIPGSTRRRRDPRTTSAGSTSRSEQGVDLLAVSFVSSGADLEPVAERLRALDADIPLIAKIEKQQAAENAEEIVARCEQRDHGRAGRPRDRAATCRVPVVQKRLIRAAGKRSKPAITATQMLASMVTARRPTRAEVTDVANAIYDGTDAVMLSEETAIGRHPIEAVRVMDRIARATEPDLRYGEWLFGRTDQATQDVADSVAQSAVGAVYRLDLRRSSCRRPAGAPPGWSPPTAPRCRCWRSRRGSRRCDGSTCSSGSPPSTATTRPSIRDLLDDCAALAARHGIAASGDLIAIVAGLPARSWGPTCSRSTGSLEIGCAPVTDFDAIAQGMTQAVPFAGHLGWR